MTISTWNNFWYSRYREAEYFKKWLRSFEVEELGKQTDLVKLGINNTMKKGEFKKLLYCDFLSF